MFRTAFANVRAQIVAGIIAAGGSAADAAAFVGSFGDGTLLQMLLAFFVANGPAIEQFIQFIISLFAQSSATTAAAVRTTLGLPPLPTAPVPVVEHATAA